VNVIVKLPSIHDCVHKINKLYIVLSLGDRLTLTVIVLPKTITEAANST
jgi:hypothetical protein